MVFENVVQFREAISKYAVVRGVQLKVRPNETRRVRAKCKGAACNWFISGSIDGNTNDFTVKTYNPVHNYWRTNKNKLCTSKFIARHYKDRIISQPLIKLWEIQELCKKQLKVRVGTTVCRRAKFLVMSQFMGDYVEEYNKLQWFVDEVLASNPGSTCFVKTDTSQPGKVVFDRFYICLNALK